MRPLLLWCTRCNKEQPTQRKGLRGPRRCMVCRDIVEVKSKYSNVPTRSKHTNRLFQSKKEANREPVLLALSNVGEITDLKYQVPFRLELYGTQAVARLLDALELDDAIYQALPKWVKQLLYEVRLTRQCVAVYKCDFQYRTKAGELVVEDPKGARTPIYSIKKRLMVLAHDIDIQEPGEGGVQMRARGAGIAGRGTGSRLMGAK